MKTLMMTCGVVALMAVAPAVAQSATTPRTTSSVASTEGQLDPTLARMHADQLKSKEVYGSDGKEVAEIEGIVRKGHQTYAVLDVDGVGGISGKDVVLAANRLHMQNDKLSVGMTKDQLQGLEKWQKGRYENVKGALK